MGLGAQVGAGLLVGLFACLTVRAQVSISGRVIDENGVAVSGVRVELRPESGGMIVVESSDPAGKFNLSATKSD